LVCRVRLYCKGADSMIYARLAPEQEVEQASQPHLAEMAREGLRTLCLGQRDITDREFQVPFSCHTVARADCLEYLLAVLWLCFV